MKALDHPSSAYIVYTGQLSLFTIQAGEMSGLLVVFMCVFGQTLTSVSKVHCRWCFVIHVAITLLRAGTYDPGRCGLVEQLHVYVHCRIKYCTLYMFIISMKGLYFWDSLSLSL